MTSESQIQAEIMLRLGSAPGVRVFRNSVGEGWVGRTIRHDGDRLLLSHPRRVTFGWCPGSSDILGFQSVVVSPEMVGRTIAQLVAVEVKALRGTVSDEQKRFIAMAARSGAAAGVARSVEEAFEILGRVPA